MDYLDINQVYHEDCLIGMQKIEPGSIDLVLCDMPYGTTACKWDVLIDLQKMWTQLKILSKPKIAIALFGIEPFSSILRMSNLSCFKYDWIWNKSISSDFMNAKNKPMNNYEIISIFSSGTVANKSHNRMPYNPQDLKILNEKVKGKKSGNDDHKIKRQSHKEIYIRKYTNYPKRILKIASQGKTIHSTQKPLSLIEYIIKTYTKEGDLILDFCMGSGTTAIAAINTNRNYIGFEKDNHYYDVCTNRINEHKLGK